MGRPLHTGNQQQYYVFGKRSEVKDRKGHETSPIYYDCPWYWLSVQCQLFRAYIEIHPIY